MKFLASNLSKYLYIAVCAIIFTQLITGYSFTIKYINTILIVLLFSYPLIRFLIAQIPAWLKVLVVLTIVGAIILIANNVLILLAFGTESETKMKSWKLNNRRVVLTKRQ